MHYRVLFYVLRTWLNDSAGEAEGRFFLKI